MNLTRKNIPSLYKETAQGGQVLLTEASRGGLFEN